MNINVKYIDAYIETKKKIEEYKNNIYKLNRYKRLFGHELYIEEGIESLEDGFHKIHAVNINLDSDMNLQLKNALIDVIKQKIETLEKVERNLIIGQ